VRLWVVCFFCYYFCCLLLFPPPPSSSSCFPSGKLCFLCSLYFSFVGEIFRVRCACVSVSSSADGVSLSCVDASARLLSLSRGHRLFVFFFVSLFVGWFRYRVVVTCLCPTASAGEPSTFRRPPLAGYPHLLAHRRHRVDPRRRSSPTNSRCSAAQRPRNKDRALGVSSLHVLFLALWKAPLLVVVVKQAAVGTLIRSFHNLPPPATTPPFPLLPPPNNKANPKSIRFLGSHPSSVSVCCCFYSDTAAGGHRNTVRRGYSESVGKVSKRLIALLNS
jgi:hypothetical protein